ncbi:MAG: PilZ domain-containing protein [Pseudomonadota bacterium]
MKLVPESQRKFSRAIPRSEVRATLSVGGHPFPAQLKDYSLRGVGLRVASDAFKWAKGVDTPVEFHVRDETYHGRVRHLKPGQFEGSVGVLLTTDASERPVSFTTEDPGWDLIEDAETLTTLFGDLATKGPECLVEARQLRGEVTLIPKKFEAPNQMEAEVHEAKRGRLETGVASFRFEIFQTCHALEGKIVSVEGDRIKIELPKKVARLLRRETVRVLNGANDRTLTIEVESELLGVHSKDLKVYDFSEHGISVIDPSGEIAAPVGFKFEKVRIATSTGVKIEGKGMVRGYRWIPEENQYAIGIGFETATDDDRTNWHNTILEARYPTLSFTYQEADHKQIWDLFDRSGYLDLKNRGSFTHLIDVTKGTWEALKQAGTKLSKRALICHDGTIVGHLQMDRVYPKTWCVHHLAIDPKVSKLVGRELYSMTTDVLSGEGAEYFLSITDSEKSWNQRNYFDFVKTYRFPNHQELKLFQFFEASTTDTNFTETNETIVVTEATRWDLQRVVRFCELCRSPLERGAFSLVAESVLDLSDLNAEMRPFGLERNRTFLVARVNGEFAGFCRAESESSGVNVFGLFDLVHVDILPKYAGQSCEITRELLRGCVNHYRALGKDKFLVLIEGDKKDEYVNWGLSFISVSARWISRCVAARRYHAFANMLFGHLVARRNAARKHTSNKTS